MFDGGVVAEGGPTLIYHNGSPHTGAILEPVLAEATARGMRLVSYARPSYGDSSPRPGRDVASAAGDVLRITDALGIDRFATMGGSGGGPHALACAALLPDRVTAVVGLASMAPFTTDFNWFAGMAAPGGLRSAFAGRDARARFAETDEFDPNSFTAADYAALEGDWRAVGADAGRAGEAGDDGLIDDDVAFAKLWGFDVASIRVPALFIQGDEDRVVPPAFALWLQQHTPGADLWVRPGDGHVSVMSAIPEALDWILARAT